MRFFRSSLWLWILVALLLSGEILLRLPAVAGSLPRPETTLWHAPLIDAKMQYFREFARARKLDVLFIGNSTVQCGIDPETFDEIRGNSMPSRGGSFNGGIEGLPPFGVRLFLDIYLSYSHPAVVIYGFSPQDLNSASPWAQNVTDRVQSAPLEIAEARRGIRGELAHFFLRYSLVYRYHFLLHQWILRGGQSPPTQSVYFDRRGFDAQRKKLSSIASTQRNILRNRAGILNYNLEGLQRDELVRLIERCRQSNIEVILVNMPLAKGYLGNLDRPSDYTSYLSTLEQLSAEYHIRFWNLENRPPVYINDDEFSDLNHLNGTGALKLTRMLAARFKTIPSPAHGHVTPSALISGQDATASRSTGNQ